ncbi:MAG: VWA domain-containing protein, partial [Burkholderiales bacterium]|nr:VWA domain-containing protein [Burkholderiales bacterium]
MEEWIGQQWHRWVTHAASREHGDAAVTLDEMRRTLTLLFRAGGGDAAVRLSPAGERRAGGP